MTTTADFSSWKRLSSKTTNMPGGALDITPITILSPKFRNQQLQETLGDLCTPIDRATPGQIIGLVTCFGVGPENVVRESASQRIMIADHDADRKPSWRMMRWERAVETGVVSGEDVLRMARGFHCMNQELWDDIARAAAQFANSGEHQQDYEMFYIATPGAALIYVADGVGVASANPGPASVIADIGQVLRIVVPQTHSAHESLQALAAGAALLPLAQYLTRDNLLDLDIDEV